jgi:hypothetical protein
MRSDLGFEIGGIQPSFANVAPQEVADLSLGELPKVSLMPHDIGDLHQALGLQMDQVPVIAHGVIQGRLPLGWFDRDAELSNGLLVDENDIDVVYVVISCRDGDYDVFEVGTVGEDLPDRERIVSRVEVGEGISGERLAT